MYLVAVLTLTSAIASTDIQGVRMYTMQDMGQKAYQKHMWGFYEIAAEMCTTALQKCGQDHRLLNNRCCAFIEMKDYKRALADADELIEHYPHYPRGYYRKGEIYMCQKKYKEAETMFLEVLKLEPDCIDAEEQLYEAQAMQIVLKLKCTMLQAQQAISVSENITEAMNLIIYEELDMFKLNSCEEIFTSDDESDSAKHSESYDPLMDPKNPLQCTTLWVGNITDTLTDELFKEIFSKFGQIKSSVIQRQKYYAFINYFDPIAPGKVMKMYQGHKIGEKCLLIKFKTSK